MNMSNHTFSSTQNGLFLWENWLKCFPFIVGYDTGKKKRHFIKYIWYASDLWPWSLLHLDLPMKGVSSRWLQILLLILIQNFLHIPWSLFVNKHTECNTKCNSLKLSSCRITESDVRISNDLEWESGSPSVMHSLVVTVDNVIYQLWAPWTIS